METYSLRARRILVLVAVTLAVATVLAAKFPRVRAQAPSQGTTQHDAPYVVEYYYKATWGHADEFLRLFKKNHLPLLKVLQSRGTIIDLKIEKPRYHTTEDARWDYRVTITWKSHAAADDPAGDEATLKKLFPDQETYGREEQRRFEILIAHWDLPVEQVNQEP